MTISLPPFSGEASRCAKCGHESARTTYVSDGEPCGSWNRLTAVDLPERLCRGCIRCGYHWDEATFDADLRQPEQSDACTSRHQTASGIEPCILDAVPAHRWHEGVTTVWPESEAL